MTWSENRRWDVSLSATMTEIDDAVASLKKNGATKIFVGGHSIGASVAVAYAVKKNDIEGVLLIAPAHTNEMEGFQEQLSANVAYAKQMVNDGKGDEVLSYPGKLCNDVFHSNLCNKGCPEFPGKSRRERTRKRSNPLLRRNKQPGSRPRPRRAA